MEIEEPFIDKKQLLRESLMPVKAGKRFLNFIIDFAVYYAFTFVIAVAIGLLLVLTGNDIGELERHPFINLLLSICTYTSYYIVFEHFFGRTIGKMITRTLVVTDRGLKPEFGQIVARTMARCIPFEQFSFLMQRPVGWHDSMSKTMVIGDSDLYHYLAEDKETN